LAIASAQASHELPMANQQTIYVSLLPIGILS
jgi:hypothetical protein